MADAISRRDAVTRRRAQLRAMGLRPVQIWVSDTRAPGFAAEARRQSELVGRSPESRDAQRWINANSVLADDANAE
jgi:Protein  of unknown function (DUF3018)